MKKVLLLASATISFLLSACGSSLDGTFSMAAGPMGKLSYTFKSNGTVLIDMYGMKSESKYELDGKNIKIVTPTGNAVLTQVDKDTIEGGMGMKLARER